MNTRFAFLTVLTICALAPKPLRAMADFQTGNDLYHVCTSDAVHQKMNCLGLVAGFLEGQRAGYKRAIFHVVDVTCPDCDGAENDEFQKRIVNVHQWLKDEGMAGPDCLPDGATIGQVADIAVKWLKENPEKRAEGISYVINTALAEAFGYPCEGEP